MADSNLLNETVNAAKSLLKAAKRKHTYFPIQEVKKPVLMWVLKEFATK